LYTFNETASFIFQKLKQGLTDKQIINAVIKKYKVKEEKVKKDFKELISDLKKKKIISVEKPKK
ncbi:PqqD family peptide modification chaperone, partial [Candidatus Roizmanbacteria bacterium]|nr:PqqD family peptide modification chaperone [Candidatus Roizmanbacteria bacterium]